MLVRVGLVIADNYKKDGCKFKFLDREAQESDEYILFFRSLFKVIMLIFDKLYVLLKN